MVGLNVPTIDYSRQFFTFESMTGAMKANSLYPEYNYSTLAETVNKMLFNNNPKKVKALKAAFRKRKVEQIKVNKGILEVELKNKKVIKVSGQMDELYHTGITLKVHSIDEIVDEVVRKTDFKKVLYLYSSGGGGHKSAKDALRDTKLSELQQNIIGAVKNKYGDEGEKMYKRIFNNDAVFVDYCKVRNLIKEKDVLLDYVGYMGKKGAEKWDEAQKRGDVVGQEKLAGHQMLSRVFFSPVVFMHTLLTLIKYKPDNVISTQAVCNDAILSAISVYNALFKPKNQNDLKMQLYMTDMPTDLSDHFFGTIKSLFGHQKKFLTLYSPVPKAGFNWKLNVGLDGNQVVELENLQLPIRPAFVNAVKEFQEKAFDPTSVKIKTSCQEERDLLNQVLKREELGATGNITDYKMGEEDEAHFIMLGSQPTRFAIYEYIEEYVKFAKSNRDKPVHLFLFLGKYDRKNDSLSKHITNSLLKRKNDCLYNEISNCLLKRTDLPENLKIVPLSFQNPEQLVGLFARCHSITRSGGATCMELLVMDQVTDEIKIKNSTYHKPERLVHSQVPNGISKKKKRKFPVEWIPLWERGNFNFMDEAFGAKVVTPGTLSNTLNKASAKAQRSQKKSL